MLTHSFTSPGYPSLQEIKKEITQAKGYSNTRKIHSVSAIMDTKETHWKVIVVYQQ